MTAEAPADRIHPVDRQRTERVAGAAGGASDDTATDAAAGAAPREEAASRTAGQVPARKPYSATTGQRGIRSFVLRQGRFTQAQQRAIDDLWPRFGLDYSGQPRDFDATFGRAAPRVLEIGFGNGGALRYSAQHDPARDHVGIEVHAPGVGRLLNGLAEDASDHVRLYHHDAVEVLRDEIASGSLDEIRIYFPDPWHKKRHQKRRLLQPGFAALLVDRIAIGGRLHLATDWADYAEQMWDVLDSTPGLRNRAGARGHLPRPPWRPQTHFESRGQRLGHGVWDLVYDRIVLPA